MTGAEGRTKRVLVIVGACVAALVLLLALFVGAIVWFASGTLANSEAAEAARVFLKNNERLKQETGEVREFGSQVMGSITSDAGVSAATLNFDVVGARRTVKASVNLIYKEGFGWRAIGASYKNDAGRTVELLDSYGAADEADEVEGEASRGDER
ncbi:MAG TPA: hypothetical protein VGV59_14300 [Pyrinomonadaceae bacterium]|nr:hypothetical protein [Pyrinomonadaceae bacterium]